MSKAYDPELIAMAHKIAKDLGIGHETRTGVYTCLGGPNYETVAELRMWKLLGVDAVGMSTVSSRKNAKKCSNILDGTYLNRFMRSSQHVIAI